MVRVKIISNFCYRLLIFKVYTATVPGIVSYVFTFSFYIFSVLCLWNIMIAVAIEVYSAVSNYFDRFAKSRVILVKKKLHNQQTEKIQRSNTVDELDNIPNLLDNESAFKINKNYLDFEFNRDGRRSKHSLYSVIEADEDDHTDISRIPSEPLIIEEEKQDPGYSTN
jgi:hypothetical protein